MTETKKPQPLPVRPRSGGIWTVLALVIIGGIIALKFVEQPANKSDGTEGSEESSATPRHLVIISIDTLRADYLGCYGKTDANTPNIDSLAKDGVLFERHYSNYPLTLPA
ncbi:MAG: sulfatase-like hydrolase/transferase, partial [Planctomycetota bacterium]